MQRGTAKLPEGGCRLAASLHPLLHVQCEVFQQKSKVDPVLFGFCEFASRRRIGDEFDCAGSLAGIHVLLQECSHITARSAIRAESLVVKVHFCRRLSYNGCGLQATSRKKE
jgi:hypothetical protein